jgi:transaldolase
MGIGTMSRPAVFLDRDGVLNRAIIRDGRSCPPSVPGEVEVPADVPGALKRLKAAGFALVVVTNQPDVARGRQTREMVEAINAVLSAQLPIDEFRVCYHDDADGCDCRKPRPGLLVRPPCYDVGASVLIGDRGRDIDAGHRAGVRATILVEGGHDEPVGVDADLRVRSLSEAADWILSTLPAKAFVRQLADLRVKIFADGAELPGMLALYARPYIQGFTTNPTLMHKAGIRDYRGFARDVLAAIPDRPISFEVLSDDFAEMDRQAREIATWGAHVRVKIPVTDTRGASACALIRRLAHDGVKLNVTALLTLAQVREACDALRGGAPSCLSVFAGRIADTGRDPVPLMAAAVEIASLAGVELIWASPRELLNIFQADEIGCHIITVTHDILRKLDSIGKDLGELSLETVRMFYDDARAAGFSL